MSHATDSLLQAYHDGELDSPAQAELRAHLDACAQCTQELNELRRVQQRVSDALALLDVSAPTFRTRASIAAVRAGKPAAARRLAFGSLARAALLLLALAGVVTAIPGTPPRRALEALLDRLYGEAPAPPAAVAPAVEEAAAGAIRSEVKIAPVDGRVRVVVHGAVSVDVTVLLVDSVKASVLTTAPGREVRFRSASGRIEVSGLNRGTLRVQVPRTVANATVEIDGQVYVYKQDGALQLTGPAGNSSGDEVSFRIGD